MNNHDENQPEVSVVIPCLNEARSVGTCVAKSLAAFQAAGIRGEVVVGDNGSTDGSQQIAEQHGARVASVKLKGYGHALRGGIEAAHGKFIIVADADDSYDLADVPRFVEKWREGYEVVMGNRFQGEIKPGAMPWHHKYIGNPILSGLLRLMFGASIRDSQCGMRGFTKDAYFRMDLRTTGMEFASEFVIKATRLGVKMTDIPITLWPDKRGRPPHLRSFRDGWRHLRFILMCAPNWLFLLPGGVLFVVGVALVAWLAPQARWVGKVQLDLHAMLFGMLVALMGAQIVGIGLFAKLYSYSERLERGNTGLSRRLKRFSLETGLMAGLVLFVIGLSGDVWVFWQWSATGFREPALVRAVIFWSLWLFLGVQVIFTSFFLSMLGVNRGTYIGDKEFQQ